MTDEQVAQLVALRLREFDKELFPHSLAKVKFLSTLDVVMMKHVHSKGSKFSFGREVIVRGKKVERKIPYYFITRYECAKAVEEIRNKELELSWRVDKRPTIAEVAAGIAAHEVRHRFQRCQSWEPYLPDKDQYDVPLIEYIMVHMKIPRLIVDGKVDAKEFDAAIVERLVVCIISQWGSIPQWIPEIVRSGPSNIKAVLEKVDPVLRMYSK